MNTELIILIIAYVSIMGIAIKILRQRDQKIKLEKYKVDIKYGPVFNIEERLDKLIDSVFDEYRFYNLEYKDDKYIASIEETKMVQDICNIVLDRISPVFYTQLCTYFNSKKLADVIAIKISTKVAEYRVLRNTNNI